MSEDIGLIEYLNSNFKNLDDKITGVHDRLDRLNGKVGEHSSSIKVLQDHDKDVTWLKRALGGMILTIVGAVIVAFMTGKL